MYKNLKDLIGTLKNVVERLYVKLCRVNYSKWSIPAEWLCWLRTYQLPGKKRRVLRNSSSFDQDRKSRLDVLTVWRSLTWHAGRLLMIMTARWVRRRSKWKCLVSIDHQRSQNIRKVQLNGNYGISVDNDVTPIDILTLKHVISVDVGGIPVTLSPP